MPSKIYSKADLAGIDVVILGGGQGNRLRDIVNDRPKPMAEINGRPFLDILIDYVASFGFRRFILSIGYLAEFIEKYYKKNNYYDIIFSKEDEPLGTGGAVKKAEEFIMSDRFLVLNGDSFCSVDISGFFQFHLQKKALCSAVVVETDNVADGGEIILDDLGRIVDFGEKQKKKQGRINAGIYVFEKKALEFIPGKTNYSLEYDLFPKLAGNEFYGHLIKEKMIDIGTPERYLKAVEFFNKC